MFTRRAGLLPPKTKINPDRFCRGLFVLLDKLEIIVFLSCLFFRGFQTMPTLSTCYKGIGSIFRNALDFFANYIYINHIRPKTLFLLSLYSLCSFVLFWIYINHNQFHKYYSLPYCYLAKVLFIVPFFTQVRCRQSRTPALQWEKDPRITLFISLSFSDRNE